MWRKFIEQIQNLLIPENKRVQKLLELDTAVMRALLPKSPTNVKDILVLFDYHNKIVRDIVKTIKYRNNASLRKIIASYLYEELTEISSDILLFGGSPPIIVPMPMSRGEKQKKGFNQCEEILREVEKLAGKNIEVSYNTLQKIRETKRQTELGREERLLNVEDSMQVYDSDSHKIKDRTVIVLDDVYTTLASFSEAKRALLSSGAVRVYGLFIAH